MAAKRGELDVATAEVRAKLAGGHVVVEAPTVAVGPGLSSGRPSEPTLPSVPQPAPLEPLGDSVAELEALAARLKRVAMGPEARAADFVAYRNALAEVTKMRGDVAPEMTELQMAKSPTFSRWVNRIIDAIEGIPGACEAVREALTRP